MRPLESYMMEAMHHFLEDGGYTTHIIVKPDKLSEIDRNKMASYIRNSHLVLNVSSSAVKYPFAFDVDGVYELAASFGGSKKNISIPYYSICQICVPGSEELAFVFDHKDTDTPPNVSASIRSIAPKRPNLTLVK